MVPSLVQGPEAPRARTDRRHGTLGVGVGIASWAVSPAHQGRTAVAVVTASGGPLP